MGALKDFMAGALHASVVSLPWRLPGAAQAGSIAGARRVLSPVLVCRASGRCGNGTAPPGLGAAHQGPKERDSAFLKNRLSLC